MRRRIWLLKPTHRLSTANATPAMINDTILPFSFPAVHAKKITAAFDGGRLTSNGGVMLLAMAERRLGLADKLARVFPDRRDPTRVVHSLVDMFRARMFAICCGYEDADDLDHLRSDPAFKLACGRLPDTGRDLCSQPTLSRLENAPRLRDVIRLTYTLVEAWMDSYPREPASVTLDIDDTCDVVHGHQQLSLFNAYYDERCFLPIHVYDTEKSRPVVIILRPGNRIDYLFGLSGTKPLAKKSTRSPTISARDAPLRTCLFCAAMPRRATRQSPGKANGAPSPVSRPRSLASTSASSSRTSISARPSGSTTACTARAAKPRT